MDKEVKEGREDIDDDHRSGRPSTSCNEETEAAVLAIVKQDRRVSVQMIATQVGISYGSAQSILTDRLGLSKLCARWVPKQLSDEHKIQRAERATEFINRFDADTEDLFRRLVTAMKPGSVSMILKAKFNRNSGYPEDPMAQSNSRLSGLS